MQKRRGFTAVELVVVMVVIGILLTIAVLSFRHTQAVARDRERDADVQAIATYLEGFYGQQVSSGNTLIKQPGSYPARELFYYEHRDLFPFVFGDLPEQIMYAPGVSDARSLIAVMNTYTQTNVNESTIVNRTELDNYAGYLYLPISQTNGNICVEVEDFCRSFKIYYRTELNGYKTVESKRK